MGDVIASRSADQDPAVDDLGMNDLPSPGSSLGNLSRNTFRAFNKALNDRIAPYGITAGQWYYLRVLWDKEGLSQRELGERVGVMQPTTVSMIRWLERAGLVFRKQDAQDGRRMNIYLTPKGRGLGKKLMPLAQEVNRAAARGLSEDELAQIRSLLGRLISNLEPASAGVAAESVEAETELA